MIFLYGGIGPFIQFVHWWEGPEGVYAMRDLFEDLGFDSMARNIEFYISANIEGDSEE